MISSLKIPFIHEFRFAIHFWYESHMVKNLSLDVNSMKPLDNLCHPVSVIKEAEELAAEAFRAEHAFFMVGGTTSSVQGMVLSCCKAGDKIIFAAKCAQECD